MKKFYGILFLLALVAFKTNVQAQTCDAVSAVAYPKNQQVGEHDYYGVRVSISQAYTHDITVTGYANQGGGGGQQFPFSLTILAGNLAAETGETFYETCSACEGPNVTITSVTPCPTYDLSVLSNSNNPNEIVGQTHNAGMTDLVPNYSSGLEPTRENAFSFTKSYLYSQGYDTITINRADSFSLQNYGQFYHQTSLTSLANSMYSNGDISSIAKDYLLQLANYISSFTADSISIPSQASYESFANNLITDENQFSNHSSLTANDKRILFSSYSVARHSVVFAVNYSNQNNYKSWFSWGSVVGGDVVGGAACAAGGAAAGLLAGGAGAVPGAIAGAVGGAISGSVYEAGIQIWKRFWR